MRNFTTYIKTLVFAGLAMTAGFAANAQCTAPNVPNAVSNQVICNGSASAATTFSGSGAGVGYSWTNDMPSIGLPAAGNGDVPSFAGVNTGTTPITATITVTPYSAASADNIFIANYNANTVSVVNAATNTITATIPVGNSPFGVVISPDGNTLYVGNNLGSTVSVVDLTTNTVTATIATGQYPNGISISPDGSTVYTGNYGDGTITVISTTTNTVVATISTGGRVVGVPVTPDGTLVYAADGLNDVVYVISTATNTIINTIGVGSGANGVAISPDGSTVYVTNVYDNTLSVIDVATNTVVATIGVGSFPFSVSVSPDGSTVYVANLGGSDVTAIDAATNTVIATISTGSGPSGVSFNADGTLAYASNTNDNTVSVINTSTNITVATISGFNLPYTFGSFVSSACSGPSTTYTITINPTPTADQVSDMAYCNDDFVGAGIPFTGTVTGTVFDWTSSDGSVGTGASGTGDIPAFSAFNGGTTPVTSIVSVTPSYTNAGTTCTGSVMSFNLVVNPTPGVDPVSDQTVCNGANTATISFTGTGTSYDWTGTDGTIGIATSGTGDIASFTATNTGTTPVTDALTVTSSYTYAGLTCSGGNQNFNITVNPIPTVDPVSDQTVCNGAPTTTVTFTGTGTSYDWTGTDGTIGISTSGSGDITSFTATNTGTTPVTDALTVTPSYTNNAVSCSGNATNFNITVNPAPTVDPVSDQTVCNGAPTATVSFTGTATSFDWTGTDGTIGISTSGSGDIISFNGINTGTTPVTDALTVTPSYINNAVTCSGTPANFNITVNPTPTVDPLTDREVCNGGAIEASFSGTGATEFDWTASTNVGPGMSGTGDISSSGSNAGTTPLTGNFTVTPYYNNVASCAGTPANFNVTVNPTPTVNAVSDQEVCNGGAITVSFTGTGNTEYDWTSGTDVGAGTGGTGDISATANNPGTTPLTGAFTVTPYYNNVVSCAGTPVNFNVTVNPTPTVNAVSDQEVCNGGAITVSFTGTGATEYDWTSGTDVGAGTSGTGDISATANNPGTTPLTGAFTVTPYYNNVASCAGTSANFNVTVNQPATFTQLAFICQGQNYVVNGHGYTTSNTYKDTLTGAAVSTCDSIITTVLTVSPTPAIPDSVSSQAVCAGSATSLVTFTGSGAGATYSWTNSDPSIGLAASGFGDISSFTATNAGAVPVTATVTVTPSFNAYAYITNNSGDYVSVVDRLTGNVVTTIPTGSSPISTTVTPDGSKVYVANRNGDNITVISTATNTVLTTIAAGSYPYGIVTSPDGSTVYVTELFSNAVTVISTATDAVVTTIPVGGDPYGLAVSPDGSKLYVSNSNDNSVSVINTASNTVTNTIFGLGSGPFGISFTPDGSTAYVANYNSSDVSVINTATETVTTSVPAGSFDYIPLVSPDGSKVYVSNYFSNSVTIISTATNTVVSTVPAGNGPFGMSFTPDGSQLYVCDFGGGTVSILETATNTIVNTLSGFSTPASMGNFMSPGATSCSGPSRTFTYTVNPPSTSSSSPVICQGQSVTVNGHVYSSTAIYIDTVVGGNSFGCDSVITTNLTVNPYGTFTQSPVICDGQSFTENGHVYTTNGTFIDTLVGQSSLSCDSIVTTNLTVNPIPGFDPPANDQVVCNGESTSVHFSGTLVGETFDWTGTDGTIGIATSGSGDIAPFNAINNGTTPVSDTIYVTPSYTNAGVTCTGVPDTLIITVNPTPNVDPSADQVVCNSGATTTVAFTGSAAGTVYNWTGTDGTIGLATSGTGDITSFTATNAGTTPVVDTIIATPLYTNAGTTCTGTADTFFITVNPTPTVNPSADQVVCNSGATSTVAFTGSVAGTVYNWTGTDGTIGLAASGTGDIASFTATNAGTTPVVDTIIATPSYTNGGTTCAGAADTFFITVNPTPNVGPSADQVVCNNGATTTVAFTGTVAGTVYNWTGTDGTIGLATSGTGDITSFTATNAGTTPVVDTIIATPSYTNAGTTCTGTADTFFITVNPTPNVGPSADQVVCNNGATTTVAFTGTVAGTVYNWTGTDGTIGLATSGSGDITSFTATNTGITPVVDTIIVTPSYTNGGTTCAGAADTFFITVNPTPTVNPSADQVVCNSGATSTVAFTGSVAGTVYNWTGTDGTIGLAASGTGDIASFTATNAGTTPVVDTIIATPSYTNGGTTCAGAADTFFITVNPTPNVGPSADQVVCNNGATTTVAFTGTVAGTVYNWTGTDGTIGLATSGTGDITSFTATNAGTTPVVDTIIATPSYTNAGTTCTGTADTFFITVNPTPNVGPSADQVVCNNGATTTVAFTGTVAGTVYNWTGTDGTIGLATSGSGDITSFTATNTGITPVVDTIIVTPSYTNGGTTCAGAADTFFITVNPTPTVNPSADQVVCNSGATSTVAFTGSVAGTVYNWTGTDGTIGLATSGTGDITSFTATNAGTTPVVDTIIATPSYTNAGTTCTGTADTFFITVNPTPTVNPSADQVVCNNGATTTVAFTGKVAGTVYNWTGTDGTIGLATSGTGDITSFTATNAGTTPVVDTIIATPSYTNAGTTCTGTADTFFITVNPTPEVDPSADQVLCNGSTTSVSFTGAVAGTVYSWTGTDGTIGIATSGSGDITSFTTTNAGTTPVVDTIIATPSYTNAGTTCTGTADTFFITVNPTPTVDPSADQVVCNSGATSTVAFTGSVAGTVYNWTGTDGTIGLAISGTGDITSFTATNAGTTPVVDTIIATPSYTNAGTTCTGTADTFFITVNPTPNVNLSADQVVCNGSTTSVSFTGAVAGTVYSWTGTDGTIGIATSGSGDITSFTTTNAGITPVVDTIIATPSYTNAGTTCTGIADTFFITVNPTPSVVSSSDQVVCHQDLTTTVSFTGAVPGTVYNWTGTDGSIGLATSGAGDIPSFTAYNFSTSPKTDTIVVTPTYTNGGVTCTGTPDTFVFTVNPRPLFDPPAGSFAVCNGSTASQNFYTTVPGTVVTWTGTDGTIGIPTSGTGDIAAFTAINTGNAPVLDTIFLATSYTNAGVTCSGQADTFVITVNPTPNVDPSADQVVCNTGATNAVSFTGTVPGTVYNWTGTDGTIGLATSGTGDIASFTATNFGSVVVTDTIVVTTSYTNAGATCTGTSDTFFITVNPTPNVVPSPDQALCNTSTTNAISFTGKVVGTVFDWTGTDGTIGLATSGTGDIAAFTAINNGNVAVIDTIVVTPSYTNGGVTCTGPSDTITITVNPTPIITPSADQQVCNGDTTHAVVFTSTVSGTTFGWTSTNASVGLATSGSGDVPSFTGLNPTTADVIDSIIVTPTSPDGCVGASDTFTITIHPTPLITLGANVTQCGGSVQIDAGNPGSSFVWSDGTTTQIDTVSSSAIYTVTVTTIYGCIDSAHKSIYINPAPSVSLGADATYCGGTATLDAGNIGDAYLWSTGATTQQIVVSTTNDYSVIVTDTSSGCQGFDTIHLTFNTLPVVNLGPDTTFCGGTITLIAGDPGNTYLWSPGGSTSNTLTVSSSGTYSVTVNYPNGCSATDDINITIFLQPNLGPDVSDSICPGSTANLYNYYQGSGLTLTYSTATPGAVDQGIYRVIGTNANGCSDTAYINITYRLKPDLGTDKTDSVCLGYTYNLHNLYPNAGYASYTWSGTFTETAVGPGTYTLVVTNASGCSDTAVATIINSQRPSLGGNKTDSICQHYTYDLTTLYPNTYTTYTWTGVADPSAVTAGTYQLVVSNGAGCTDTAYATITYRLQPVVTLAISPNLCSTVPAFTLTGGAPAGGTYFVNNVATSVFDPSILGNGPQYVVYVFTNTSGCTDSAATTITIFPQPVIVDTVAFPPVCTNSQAIDLNQYFTPNGGSFSGAGVSGQYFYPTLTGAGADAITYIYTDQHGCMDTAVRNLTVLNQVHVTLHTNSANFTICKGDSIVFFAAGATDYQFFVNGVAVTSISDTAVFSSTTLQNHDQVTVVGSNGCSSETSDMIIIDVNEAPVADAGRDTTIDLGQTAQLQGTGTGGTGNLTYSWTPTAYLNFSNVPNPKYNGLDTVMFVLRVTDANGCFDTASVTVNVHVPDNVLLPNIITPNGDGQNDAWILNPKINLAGSHLVVFNRWGEKVYEATDYNNNWKGTYMDTNDKLPDGTYYYVLKVPAQNNHEYTGPINLLSTQK